jgi:putative nucleotidyltransferase with HDIG domain
VHRYSVLEHALVAAEWMDVLLRDRSPASTVAAGLWRALWEGADWSTSTWGPVDLHLRRNAAALRAATLLHDVGKPATRTIEADGRTRFFGHAELGADIAVSVLERWRFPHAFVERVALLVRQHLRPGQIATTGAAPTERALYRFQRALGDATPDVCWLFLADSLATVGAEALATTWPAYVAHVHRIVTWQPSATAARLRRVLDGHALMAATGLEPGPRVGHVLAAIDEAVATGEVQTEEQALALARQIVGAEVAVRDAC